MDKNKRSLLDRGNLFFFRIDLKKMSIFQILFLSYFNRKIACFVGWFYTTLEKNENSHLPKERMSPIFVHMARTGTLKMFDSTAR